MGEAEGIIKFQLDFTEGSAPSKDVLTELNAWRKILYLTGLIGQTPKLYDGYAYGNVSMRLPNDTTTEKNSAFIICGTQTGGVVDLTPNHYTTIHYCDHQKNKVIARGPITPSSESMTHGIIYDQDENITCVLHAHSSIIWRNAKQLNLPTTGKDVAYGSPQMADAVNDLFDKTDLNEQKVFSMAGHDGGIVSFGSTPQIAGTVMMQTLARALSLEYT